MTCPPGKNQTPQPIGNESDSTVEPAHLPDALVDDDPSEVCDLPRIGVAKPVVNITKATVRLPDVLIED